LGRREGSTEVEQDGRTKRVAEKASLKGSSMSNVPTKRVGKDRTGLQPEVTRKLNRAQPKNRNMGASIRGRQHGGGFPTNQV
jgi:hypothetical protein